MNKQPNSMDGCISERMSDGQMDGWLSTVNE